MRLYKGTKQLRAAPMTRGEYNLYRGWAVPVNEDPTDPGFLVEYVDGGRPNDPRHAGYISWSPKDVFERSYNPVVEAVEAARAASTGPRVTPEDIDDAIAGTYWFNAFDAVGPDAPRQDPLKLLTICVCVLRNGFTVVGTSACASPENFKAEIGQRVALDDAKRQIWPLLGFELRTKLAAQQNAAHSRVAEQQNNTDHQTKLIG